MKSFISLKENYFSYGKKQANKHNLKQNNKKQPTNQTQPTKQKNKEKKPQNIS